MSALRPTRRVVVTSLMGTAATLLAGCPRRAPDVAAAAQDAVRLGWRWTPGMRHTWRSRVTRAQGATTSWREEVWSYLATDLDPTGVAWLEGELLALTVGGHHGEAPLPNDVAARLRREALDAAPSHVDLGLRLNGKLLAATPAGFGETLPHHLLAGVLPVDPARPGDTWEDPAMALPLAALAPVGIGVRVDAETRLEALDDVDGDVVARLRHSATIRTIEGGPVLRVVGASTFATWPGHLANRELTVTLAPDPVPGERPVGTLTASLQLVPERGAA